MKKTNPALDNLRHSLAHLLAKAVLELYPGAHNAIGPSIESGFYQDFDMGNATVTDADLPKIEKKMRQILPTWKPFTFQEVTLAEAEKLFSHNPYKIELAREFAKEGKKLTTNNPGNFLDLCKMGHVENPAKDLTHFKLLSVAGAYWRGDEKKRMLTRIYGTGFPTKEGLDAYLKQLEEAAKRDHRKLGKELDLFLFSPNIGAGLPIFTPRGTIVRNAIRQFSLELEQSIGYEEVYTPNMNKAELFKISGHYDKFKESMFRVHSNYGEEAFYLKPMNCPQHTQIYAAQLRSYRDLPLRYADFANLYRDEKPGELGGLTRVRYFSQDDSHCFCREDQIEKEMTNIFAIIKKMMRVYGLEYWIRLSLRDPEAKTAYLGSDAVWEKAQATMESFLQRHEIPYERAEGEAAFYGPKMDLMCKTAIGHDWQLATIQLDYIMPERFKLSYIDKAGKEAQPVMIHKAMAGSFERFIAILLEHYGGNLPLWLSPVHLELIPVASRHEKPAKKLEKEFQTAGLRVHVDDANETVGYKIRKATKRRIPYVVVLGDKEAQSTKLALRIRGSDRVKAIGKKRFLALALEQINKRRPL